MQDVLCRTPQQALCSCKLHRGYVTHSHISARYSERTALFGHRVHAPRLGARPIHRRSTAARAQSEEEELPPWARKDQLKKLAEKEGKDLPFGLYLFLATIMGIVAVGSVSEYLNKNAIFNRLQPDSPAYIPVILLFVIGGIGWTGFFFKRAVDAFNKDAAQQDSLDGY